MQVEDWLTRAARRVPERIAIETPERAVTYAELDRLAGAGARELAQAPGTPVGIALPAGLDFAIALHACLRAGAVAVPIDPRDPAARREAVTVDAPLPAPARAAFAPPPPRAAHDLGAIALIVRTSGSSGTPKEVPLSYGNFLWSAIGSAVALGLDPGERWLCTLPPVHVGGLSILLRSAIYGTTAVLHERFDAAAAVGAIRDDRITLVSVVATTLARLLDGGLERPPALRCALAGGGPVPAALLDRARAAGVSVAQTYGLTEACSQVATQAPGELRADAGPPLFCTRVAIAADGEILVSGPTVSPAAGATLATGDLGALEPDGALRVIGRKADTIISGGENVAPAEVEAALEAHPAVLEAGVYGVPDREWGEAVCARVVLREAVAEEELRRHAARLLAPAKVPKRIEQVAALPRTASGKLRRGLLAVDETPARP